MIATALTLLAGPLGRYALIGLGLFTAVLLIRQDARREVIAACEVKLQRLDTKWRTDVEAANQEARQNVALAMEEARKVADAPSVPADLVRLCKSEPAGCRARKP